MKSRCRVIAVGNQKGGVGKTVTTINIGACLASFGKKVLLIDMDPQANLTKSAGLSEYKSSVYNLLLSNETNAQTVIYPTKFKNLHIIPSHIDLSSAEIEMVPLYGREFLLKKRLADIVQDYDFIIIDCPPSLSLLMVNALTTAKELLIPVQAHHFALEGLSKLMDIFDIIKGEMNEDLNLLGVVVTMFDPRTRVSKDALNTLKQNPRIKNKLFNTIVHTNVKLVESGKKGLPIIYYRKNCHGSKAYTALAKEILSKPAR